MSDAKYVQALMDQKLDPVVEFFQNNGEPITQSDFESLSRDDCVDFFGKVIGPVYFNRIAKLNEELTASASGAAPAADEWGATAAPAADERGASETNSFDAAPADGGFDAAPANDGFGGDDGFGDEEPMGPPEPIPDAYGIRMEFKGRAKCFAYKRGLCTKGDACKFIHEGQETKGSRGEYSYEAEQNKHKKGPCISFASGGCERGPSCIFIHDPNFKPGPPTKCGDFARGECTRDPCRFSHDPDAPDAPRSNLCYAFQRGECENGDDCIFAHPGVHDGKPREPREKSDEPCHQFEEGTCERGDNCRFTHGEGGGDAAPAAAFDDTPSWDAGGDDAPGW